MKLLIAFALVTVIPMAAQAEVIVSSPWARASVLISRPGAAYMTIASDIPDRLVAVKTPVAGQVMLHRVDTDAAGVSRMVHLERLDLSPGTPVVLRPGGLHLMLMDFAAKLQEGESFPITLFFESAGEVTVEVPIHGPGAAGPEDGTR
nr:copper chaperone PCu(A)C [arsenite-oxidising bacterium NT-25]